LGGRLKEPLVCFRRVQCAGARKGSLGDQETAVEVFRRNRGMRAFAPERKILIPQASLAWAVDDAIIRAPGPRAG
jgi:hypothetical protein